MKKKNYWKLRLSRKSSIWFLLVLLSASLQAQYDNIDKDYYSFPIQPESENFLSGNMGELRSSHFHAGLDIKTNGVEGLEVYSAADGYVSRIRVGTGGYGNCIYIQHPNGTSTVYAHLSKFARGIKKGVRVKQGQTIGYVGSTGKSTGPHLHYEVLINGKRVNSQTLKLPSGKILKGENRILFETKKIKLNVLKSEKIVGIN